MEHAIVSNDLPTIDLTLRTRPLDSDAMGSLLLHAPDAGAIDAVDLLLNRRANVNVPKRRGEPEGLYSGAVGTSCGLWSVREGYFDLLVKSGADPTSADGRATRS